MKEFYLTTVMRLANIRSFGWRMIMFTPTGKAPFNTVYPYRPDPRRARAQDVQTVKGLTRWTYDKFGTDVR
jgi:hypothetical protein